MKPIYLSLDFPPSANTYYRSIGRGRVILSARGREFASAVYADCVSQLVAIPRHDVRLAVSLLAHPPDRRKRDIDNVLKPTLDALTKAGVWVDDSQIDYLEISRGEIVEGGKLWVAIREHKA